MFIRAFLGSTSKAGWPLGAVGLAFSRLSMEDFRFRLATPFRWFMASMASLISLSLSSCNLTAFPEGRMTTSPPK